MALAGEKAKAERARREISKEDKAERKQALSEMASALHQYEGKLERGEVVPETQDAATYGSAGTFSTEDAFKSAKLEDAFADPKLNDDFSNAAWSRNEPSKAFDSSSAWSSNAPSAAFDSAPQEKDSGLL